MTGVNPLNKALGPSSRTLNGSKGKDTVRQMESKENNTPIYAENKTFEMQAEPYCSHYRSVCSRVMSRLRNDIKSYHVSKHISDAIRITSLRSYKETKLNHQK